MHDYIKQNRYFPKNHRRPSEGVVSDEDLDALAEIQSKGLLKEFEESFKQSINDQIKRDNWEHNHKKHIG